METRAFRRRAGEGGGRGAALPPPQAAPPRGPSLPGPGGPPAGNKAAFESPRGRGWPGCHGHGAPAGRRRGARTPGPTLLAGPRPSPAPLSRRERDAPPVRRRRPEGAKVATARPASLRPSLLALARAAGRAAWPSQSPRRDPRPGAAARAAQGRSLRARAGPRSPGPRVPRSQPGV